MSRWGNVDFEALLKLQKNLEKVAASVDDLCVRSRVLYGGDGWRVSLQ